MIQPKKADCILTAQGELKLLVVFVRFKDDVSSHPYWPVGQPPTEFSTYIDPNFQTGSINYLNLTNYFKQMSFSIYKVTGQAVYVETPNNRAYYGSNYYLANKEVLQQKVDPLINFAIFDNWSSSANYTHSNTSDGTVDMIVMIWRCSFLPFPFGSWSGEASLGYGASYTVESGSKTIKAGFGLNAGSGITLHYWGERTQERNFKNVVHEMGHWLLGVSHPYTNYTSNDEHKVWGMLTRGDDGICANTYERERVAWVNPPSISGDLLNVPFQDYIQYGTTYKYHPSNGSTDEYFYFENHQKLSIYDNATNNSNDKGIFVTHQQGAYNSTNNIRVKTSNGQWDWQNTGTTSCWSSSVPKFKPTAVNRAGRNNKDKLLKTGSGSEWLFYLDGWSTGTWPSGGCGDWLNGGGLNNAFNLTYNDVFSNYSNPWARRWANDATNNFTMEIIAQNGSVVNAKFYITNPTAGKPSKPQNLQVGPNPGNNRVKLTWDANIDPDLSSYEIWRNVNNWQWFNIATTTNTYFIDPNYYYGTPNRIDYKIRAKDTGNNYSIFSDGVFCYGYPSKAIANYDTIETSNSKPKYSLSNYPNPFNPTTTISYQIEEKGFVSLKVYDILGKEVANLVSEEKEQGIYNTAFDGANFPSGIYIYSWRVNNFTSVKKMALMK